MGASQGRDAGCCAHPTFHWRHARFLEWPYPVAQLVRAILARVRVHRRDAHGFPTAGRGVPRADGAGDEARAFTWLRQTLPEHVSLVVSTTEIPVGLESTAQVAVEDFPVREAEEVLAAWLQDAHRKLEPEPREKVLSGFAPSGLPLYLKLAFEEARSWASHLPLEGCMLGEGVEGVIDTLLNRLSFEANHGPLLAC